MADIDVDLIVEAISRGFDRVSADMREIGAASRQTGDDVAAATAKGSALGSMLGGLAAQGFEVVARSAALAAQELAQFTLESIGLASNMAETANLIDSSLGPAAEGFRQELELIAEATGRSANALEMGAQTIVAMTRSMGMGQEEAAGFAANMAQIALDLGSFFNQDPAQVFLDMQSALAGSMETMQKYGIDVRESALQAIALAEGLITAGEEMDRVTRAQALQIAIVQQAGDAMGDAAKTADSFANTTRAIQDTVLDAKIAIGEALLPAVEDVVGAFSELVEDVLPRLIELMAPGIATAAGAVADEFGRVVDGIEDEDIVALAEGFGNLASALAVAVILGSRFSGWLEDNMEKVRNLGFLLSAPWIGLGAGGFLVSQILQATMNNDFGSELSNPLLPAKPTEADIQRAVDEGVAAAKQVHYAIEEELAQLEAERRAAPGREARRIERLSAASGWSMQPMLDWQAQQDEMKAAADAAAAEAAEAAARSFASAFQQALGTEGGLNIEEMLFGEGIELGLPIEQLAQLGLAAGKTGEDLRTAAIDALVWQEAMRLMGEVDDGRRSVESMQLALENFRKELENWDVAVPAAETAGSKMTRDAMLAFENVPTTLEPATQALSTMGGLVEAVAGEHEISWVTNSEEIITNDVRRVDKAMAELTAKPYGMTIGVAIEMTSGSEQWLLDAIDAALRRQGELP